MGMGPLSINPGLMAMLTQGQQGIPLNGGGGAVLPPGMPQLGVTQPSVPTPQVQSNISYGGEAPSQVPQTPQSGQDDIDPVEAQLAEELANEAKDRARKRAAQALAPMQALFAQASGGQGGTPNPLQSMMNTAMPQGGNPSPQGPQQASLSPALMQMLAPQGGAQDRPSILQDTGAQQAGNPLLAQMFGGQDVQPDMHSFLAEQTERPKDPEAAKLYDTATQEGDLTELRKSLINPPVSPEMQDLNAKIASNQAALEAYQKKIADTPKFQDVMQQMQALIPKAMDKIMQQNFGGKIDADGVYHPSKLGMANMMLQQLIRSYHGGGSIQGAMYEAAQKSVQNAAKLAMEQVQAEHSQNMSTLGALKESDAQLKIQQATALANEKNKITAARVVIGSLTTQIDKGWSLNTQEDINKAKVDLVKLKMVFGNNFDDQAKHRMAEAYYADEQADAVREGRPFDPKVATANAAYRAEKAIASAKSLEDKLIRVGTKNVTTTSPTTGQSSTESIGIFQPKSQVQGQAAATTPNSNPLGLGIPSAPQSKTPVTNIKAAPSGVPASIAKDVPAPYNPTGGPWRAVDAAINLLAKNAKNMNEIDPKLKPQLAMRMADLGMEPNQLTGDMQQRARAAHTAIEQLDNLKALMDAGEKAGELGTFKSRWNDLLTNKLGEDTTKGQVYAHMDTAVKLLISNLSQMHGGARAAASPQMREYYTKMLMAPDPSTMRAKLDEARKLADIYTTYTQGPASTLTPPPVEPAKTIDLKQFEKKK